MPKKRTARPADPDAELRRPEPPERMTLSDRDAAALVAGLLDTAPRNQLLIMAAKAYLHRVDPDGSR